MKRRFEPILLKLANYMGFFIEWKYQIAMGNRYFSWVTYSGVNFRRVELYDESGNPKNLAPIMSFEEYCGWSDMEEKFSKDPDLNPNIPKVWKLQDPMPESLIKLIKK